MYCVANPAIHLRSNSFSSRQSSRNPIFSARRCLHCRLELVSPSLTRTHVEQREGERREEREGKLTIIAESSARTVVANAGHGQ